MANIQGLKYDWHILCPNLKKDIPDEGGKAIADPVLVLRGSIWTEDITTLVVPETDPTDITIITPPITGRLDRVYIGPAGGAGAPNPPGPAGTFDITMVQMNADAWRSYTPPSVWPGGYTGIDLLNGLGAGLLNNIVTEITEDNIAGALNPIIPMLLVDDRLIITITKWGDGISTRPNFPDRLLNIYIYFRMDKGCMTDYSPTPPGGQNLVFTPYPSDEYVEVGPGTDGVAVPVAMNGMTLSDVLAATPNPGLGIGQTAIQIRRVRVGPTLGDATTEFDITNPAGITFHYLYNGTGTNPNIADSDASLRIGDVIDIQAQNFNVANNGIFTITAVGAGYFEVTNAAGVVESNKTIGTGYITPQKSRNMLSVPVRLTAGQYSSHNGTISPTINDLATGDLLYVDILAVTFAPPFGLSVTISAIP